MIFYNEIKIIIIIINIFAHFLVNAAHQIENHKVKAHVPIPRPYDLKQAELNQGIWGSPKSPKRNPYTLRYYVS